MSLAQLQSQQSAARILGRSLERGRLPHALLFSGPAIAPLEEAACCVAQVLNCSDPPSRGEGGVNSDCCDRCLSCRRIIAGSHSDIQWVRPESKTRVITMDQIRDLLQTIHLKPTEGTSKVAVLVEADRLNPQSGNAFLKTLEEPPKNSVLILLTTDPDRVMETIVSRCLRFTFGAEPVPDSTDEVSTWLVGFGSEAAKAQRGLLQRYCLLSLLLKRLSQIKEDVEPIVTRRSPLEQHEEIEPRLREKWEDELSAAIESEYRRRRSELLVRLEWWFRDIWLHTEGVGSGITNAAHETDVRAISSRLSPSEARDNLAIEQTIGLLNTNVQEALALEVGFLGLKL